MKLPTIAPLTRREAKAARLFLSHCLMAKEVVPPGSNGEEFIDAAIAATNEALAEYDQRPLIGRILIPPAGHRTRLRQWMLEVAGFTEIWLAELDKYDRKQQ